MMRVIRRIRTRLRNRRFNHDLAEELRFHEEMKRNELEAAGMTVDDARVAARRALGNVTLMREESRGVWIAPWIEGLWQDARYATRSLSKSPGFALAAILTLGVGIGLNVSLFTVFNMLALQQWDVSDPEEVVLPFAKPVGKRGFSNWMPYAEYVHLRDHTRTLASLVARASGSGRVFQSDGTSYDRAYDYVQFEGVSAEFFAALGVEIAQGRGFRPGEDAAGAPLPVAVITHAFWQNQLGADPDVLGRTLHIGVRNVPVTIVGVTRRGFTGVERLQPTALFVPLPLLRQIDPDGTDGRWDVLAEEVSVAGRLRADSSRKAAEAELDTLSRQFRAAATLDGEGLVLTGTRPIGQPGRTNAVLPGVVGLGGAVLIVLLLACANVGNLQLARAFARQRELAIRLSLGAARGRLIRQLLTEAAALASAAALLGFAVAWFLPNVVLRLAGESGDRVAFVPDVAVFTFAMVLGLVSAILFALAPALRATRVGGPLTVRARTEFDRGGRRLRSLLLAAQVALSLTLLTAAGLLTRGILHAHQMDVGFDASRVGSARITVPKELYTRAALSALWRELDDRLAAAPVGTIARTDVEPLDDSPFLADVRKPGEGDAWNVRARERQLSPSGFALLGLAFAAGSPYSDRPEVHEVVINQTLARQIWPDRDPVGRTLLADDQDYRITGVVRDSYYTTPTEIRPVLFRPPALSASRLLFRFDQPGAAAALEGMIKAVEPRLGVTIAPVTANIDAAVRTQRGIVGLVWAVGLLGLLLATVGVFGVFAYAVEERRREIGVRLALGARARDIYRALFDVNRWSVGAGLAVGLVLSAIAGFLLRSYLFGLHPLDPVAYLGVSVLIAAAAVAAVAVPGRRALRVDPAVTLKGE